MLSRLTKLPVVSSLFPLNNEDDYPQEMIDLAVTEIKNLGRYDNNTNNYKLLPRRYYRK